MKKEQFIANMMDKLSGDLTEKDAHLFAQELNQNPEQKEDFEFFEKSWKAMDQFQVGEPSDTLRLQFYNQLEDEIKRRERSSAFSLQQFWAKITQPIFLARASFGLLLLAVGFILGGQFSGNKTINNYSAAAEQAEESQVNFTPANVRLQNVFNVKNGVPKTEAANVLLSTLENDPNVNVRLVALEELREFTNNSKVRQKLVKHVKKETSPLVQVMLLNVLMENANPKVTIDTMEKLLDDKKLNPVVVEKIEKDLPLLKASL